MRYMELFLVLETVVLAVLTLRCCKGGEDGNIAEHTSLFTT